MKTFPFVVRELGTYIRVENFGYSRDLRLGTALGLSRGLGPSFHYQCVFSGRFYYFFVFILLLFLAILVNF